LQFGFDPRKKLRFPTYLGKATHITNGAMEQKFVEGIKEWGWRVY